MNSQIRPLKAEDINRVSEIERQAFPRLWPPTPFKRELDSRRTSYLVAWKPKDIQKAHAADNHSESTTESSRESILGKLFDTLKWFVKSNTATEELDYHILGFVGLWFMGDESHIIGIAVEEESRGKGIGELLLLSAIELAKSRQAAVVSLEARVSNYVAQSLYQKYGFKKVGIRKAYYTDNREDAAIMTTLPINSHDYQKKFQSLLEAYRQRHGDIGIKLA